MTTNAERHKGFRASKMPRIFVLNPQSLDDARHLVSARDAFDTAHRWNSSTEKGEKGGTRRIVREYRKGEYDSKKPARGKLRIGWYFGLAAFGRIRGISVEVARFNSALGGGREKERKRKRERES